MWTKNEFLTGRRYKRIKIKGNSGVSENRSNTPVMSEDFSGWRGKAGKPLAMSKKEFEKEMEKLQVELVKLQEWVKATGAKICVLFEGRDTAGKGGVIRRITERVSPRVFRVVALSSPTDREKSQMYFQRYMPHLPAAGEVVLPIAAGTTGRVADGLRYRTRGQFSG
jgi:polyphosphate kinase 2 (PPK2 family)